MDYPGIPVHAIGHRLLDLRRQKSRNFPKAWPGERQSQSAGIFRNGLAFLPGIVCRDSFSWRIFFFVMAISWIFGREFADGTLKDMLAVPVQRSNILLAKFIVAIAWCAVMAIIIFIFGLVIGALIQLPGGALGVILQGSAVAAITVSLTIAVVIPFAFFASLGRGYLLSIGVAVLALMAANLVVVFGWGEYFPWAVPLLYAQGKSSLTAVSYWIVFFTSLGGMIATYLWWKYADQNR